ncbi:TAT-variant-translocated molybdopterin oxidoreductase [Robertkochia sediminum]|uniref:TAT-variant-translocated molybdopterin oxidoreductase n=1 Tax=Robertkochia sediminum TaxID=2785326 RepID=UPI001933E3CD|nr:TAT-variant-translocated molybdopterin oxidoreductase [Robertkochia sediminum]MBL7473916.1 TAT-variant-translocated molybdopterin oxidoreductase [Robertkochia sediminum]
MASNKKYWKSVEELNPDSSVVETLKQNEFVEEIPVDEFLGDKESLAASSTTRRDFLKYVGFSTAAASLAACEGPVKKSIPYVVQPEEIVPGVANYYATHIADGYDFASVLIKTREGRPIKVENNGEAKAGFGANARVHASVLGLYDNLRVQGPKANGAYVDWSEVDAKTVAAVKAAQAAGKDVVFLTQTFASPSTAKLVAEFKGMYPNTRHVVYDAVSEAAALDAYKAKYGVRAMADYDLAKAGVIVSFGADILGDWQGGGYDSDYAKGRVPHEGKMSRHVQFESNMTLSGSNADKRVPVTPAQLKVAMAKFYGYLMGAPVAGELPEAVDAAVKNAAAQVKDAGSKAVVVTGINDINAQALALEINEKISSAAFSTQSPKLTRQGDPKQVMQLVADMAAGKVGVLITVGVNPAYTLPNAAAFAEAMKNVEHSVVFSQKEDETAVLANYIAAAPHYLESWGDVELKKGHYGLMQPTIRPLFNTRQFQDSLLAWMGSDVSYYNYLKANWDTNILGGASWQQALHDGVFEGVAAEEAVAEGEAQEEEATVAAGAAAARALAGASQEGMALVLYSKTGMGDGQQANNPWLQEFPDPITRVSWDNYLTVSAHDAKALGLENYNVANGALNGSYAKVVVNGVSLNRVPVIIQPGQARGTAGLSFGYGRTAGMKNEMKTGVNAFALYNNFDSVQSVTIEKVSGEHEFACVQLHNTLMGRGDIVKETTLEIFNTKDSREWNHVPQVSLNHEEVDAVSVDLWDEFDSSIGHHFNLSIDLNACTGCGACVIACHAENNVPVVGKAEVRKSRDMHWLRIDRYYSSEDTFQGDNETKDNMDGLGDSLSTFGEMEVASENPQVAFQPVMCQHCNHAPCETVCPVAATSHGRQGQNQMAYNRCVGTRYCANNCPYKVRRFNWFLYSDNDEFDFHMNDNLGKMVLNPDVTVRSRGVMEKCSMCIQKTQKTILDAKREGREIKDGEFQTACSAACSSGAMVFGDVNDKESKVAKLKESDRMYHLLEHVGTKPNVFYHVKVRNTQEA